MVNFRFVLYQYLGNSHSMLLLLSLHYPSLIGAIQNLALLWLTHSHCFSFKYFKFLLCTESRPSEMSTLSLTPASMASSLPSIPSPKSNLQMLGGMTPPANCEPLDPTFLLVWPHPQGITQIKGTRFFPTSVLPVVLFRDLQSGKGTTDDAKK